MSMEAKWFLNFSSPIRSLCKLILEFIGLVNLVCEDSLASLVRLVSLASLLALDSSVSLASFGTFVY